MRPGELLSVGGTLPKPTIPGTTAEPARRPDFQAAKLDALAAKQAVALEQARRYDDVEAGIFTAAERKLDAPNGFGNEAIVGLRFKVALPFWNKNEGAIHEAEAKQQRREKDQILVHIESRQPGNPPPIIELKAPLGGLIVESHIRIGDAGRA